MFSWALRACSSVVEHHTDNVRVDGSIPSTRTSTRLTRSVQAPCLSTHFVRSVQAPCLSTHFVRSVQAPCLDSSDSLKCRHLVSPKENPTLKLLALSGTVS